MNKIQKGIKKLMLILSGKSQLAFKRKKIREARMANGNGQSRTGRSQFGQDDWILDYYSSRSCAKTFVEFGAHDGITNSNTYRLENEFGWSGLLVEPIPDAYKSLIHNRTSRTIHGCVSTSIGTVFFLEVTGPACQLSGIFSSFPASHIKRIDNTIQREGGTKVMHEINSTTLEQLLIDQEIQNIDYLSIDTEGSEYDILKIFPFEKFQIGVIAIENQYHGDFLIDLMDRNGFELVDIVGGDEIYVNPKYSPIMA